MRKKLCIFAVALAFVMIAATGQRGFADISARPLDTSASGLSGVYNQVFGTSVSNESLFSTQARMDGLGTFNLQGVEVFLVSAKGTTGQMGLLSNLSGIGGFQTDHYLYLSNGAAQSVTIPSATNAVYTGTLDGQFGFQVLAGGYAVRSSTFSLSPGHPPQYDINYIYFDVSSLMDGYSGYLIGVNNDPIGADAYGYDDLVFLVRWESTGGDIEPGGVPEPATMLLWTLGGLSLAGASWRRKRNMRKILA